MAGFTNLASLITPSVFTGMALERTKELTAFVDSGIVQSSPILTNWLESEIGSGGGNVILNRPTWKDLDSSAVERSGDFTANSPLYSTGTVIAALGSSTLFPLPQGIDTFNEVCVRVDRNNHWSENVLATAIAGTKNPDPVGVIGDLVATYWARRFQQYCLKVIEGVLADNTANDSGDYTFDVSGSAFVPGVTSFTAEALYDARQTLGDAASSLTNIAVHSAVHTRMLKNDLIDYAPDSTGKNTIPMFAGMRVTVDDGMPKTGNVCDSYLFGPGFLEYGTAAPKNATSTVWRDEGANGNGVYELWNRVTWCVHPMGHAYTGATTVGLPSNTTIAAAASWNRVSQTRKNIPFARLRTREA